MIEVKNLTFEYPDKAALNDVSFNIEPNTITALVGPNGSGKTTLLRCLAALAKPGSGDIWIHGFHTGKQPQEVHKHTGFLQDLFGLYDALTVYQCLQFMAYSMIGEKMEVRPAFDRVVHLTGIEDFLDKKVGHLSRGMRQKVGIAAAVIHQPPVLFLDEPASGLDPEARHDLSNLLVTLRKEGMTIMVSSHILAELADYSTDMLVIQGGRMVENKKLVTQPALAGHYVLLEVGADDSLETHQESIRHLSGVNGIKEINGKIHVHLDLQMTSKHKFLNTLISNGFKINEFTEVKINLQDEYIKTVQQFKENNRK